MNNAPKIRVGIVGPKALTAGILLEMLLQHPGVEVTSLWGREDESASLADYFPTLRGRLERTPSGGTIREFDAEACAAACDTAFLCLPHKTAATYARDLHARGCRVVDLSADFRFTNLATYEEAYALTHPAPELNAEAPYALAEVVGKSIEGAQIIGVPGCNSTSALLPL